MIAAFCSRARIILEMKCFRKRCFGRDSGRGNAAEAEMVGRGVGRLREAGGGTVAGAVVLGAQERAAFDDLDC